MKIRLSLSCLFAALLLFGHSNRLLGGIKLDQDLDSGALDTAQTVVEEADGPRPVITLAPRELASTGRWFHFRLRGAKGKQPIFRIPLEGDARGAHREEHRYVFSLDGGRTYCYFERAEGAGGNYTFAPEQPFSQDELIIAYSLPYPFSRTASHTRWIARSEWVDTLPEAGREFFIGHTAGTEDGDYTDDLGRDVPSLPLLAYRITDPRVPDNRKQNVVLMSGTHASESTGNFVLEGFVDFLLTDHPIAGDLRRNLVFDVYPQVNPEGRWGGYQRTSPQHPSVNFNRDWDEMEHDAIRVLTAAMRRNAGEEAALLIDFHSHRTGFLEFWDDEHGRESPFFTAFQRRHPELKFHRLTAPGAAHIWAKQPEGLNAKHSFIAETGFIAGWQTEDYHRIGRDWAMTVHEVMLNDEKSPQPEGPRYVMVIHGGAGVSASLSEERLDESRQALAESLRAGYAKFQEGASSLDAVEAAIMVMENSPAFNAGKGAVFTHDGRNELDSSIMNGSDLNAGAVAGVTTIKNPILAARAVMEQSEHVLLGGPGAEKFAESVGLETVDPEYFRTERRWQSLQRAIELESQESSLRDSNEGIDLGTVGAVALDRDGNIAAGTSTGGRTNKRHGRIGDSPIIGAGTYADNATVGVSSTGWGEMYIRTAAAYRVSALMEFQKLAVSEAASAALEKVAEIGGNGGLIALDRNGNLAMPYNTAGMYRGAVTESGEIEIYIYDEEEPWRPE